ECLSNGVPMVAIPITNDQPGVAARIAWTGTGEMVSVSKLSTARLRTEVQRVLGDHRYRDNAKKLQQAIRSRDAISMAAELIESVLRRNLIPAPSAGEEVGFGRRFDFRELLRVNDDFALLVLAAGVGQVMPVRG